MRITTKVEGLQRALSDIAAFGGKIKTRAIRKCLTAAAQPPKRAAQQDAPRGKTGTLARGQVVKIKSYRRGAVVVAYIGARNRKYANNKNPAKYSHLVHDPHRTRGGGGMTRGNPYLKRAAIRSLPSAERIFAWKIKGEIYAIANEKGVNVSNF